MQSLPEGEAPEETTVGGALVAARDRGRDAVRLVESCLEK